MNAFHSQHLGSMAPSSSPISRIIHVTFMFDSIFQLLGAIHRHGHSVPYQFSIKYNKRNGPIDQFWYFSLHSNNFIMALKQASVYPNNKMLCILPENHFRSTFLFMLCSAHLSEVTMRLQLTKIDFGRQSDWNHNF